jgi:glutaredoxin
MLADWFRWLRHGRNRGHWQVQLYTRQGCHLCETAHTWLLHQQATEGFVLTVLDIDDHPSDRERYQTCVPVIAINGKVRFRGRINPVLWHRIQE